MLGGFLESLAGRRLRTVTGRENWVLGCDAEAVRVWTARSPSGQAVPIMWVQEALDRLERYREIEISVQSVGYRSAYIGAGLGRASRSARRAQRVAAADPAGAGGTVAAAGIAIAGAVGWLRGSGCCHALTFTTL
jgi:hypothetical protein